MNRRGIGIRRTCTTVALAAIGAAVLAVSAQADVVDYVNSTPAPVANNSTVNPTVTVPAGREPVESVEVRNVQPIWATGGTDTEMQLKGPDGQSLYLWTIGCPSMPSGTHFSVIDGSLTPVDSTVAFCNNELQGGGGSPHDPDSKMLSIFSGGPSSGTWTATVRDAGIQSGGGTLNGWTLRITHADLNLTAKAHGQKLRKRLHLRLKCNANCTVSKSGDAKSGQLTLIQDQGQTVNVALKKNARKRLAKRLRRGPRPVFAKLKLRAVDDRGNAHRVVAKIKVHR